MPGTAWRASAIPFPGGPAPTGNGRQRRPGKRPGRRMLCGQTSGERTRRSSSRLRAGERFFRQRLHGTPAVRGGRPLNASARAGRLFTAASGERFFRRHRIGRPANRAGYLFVAHNPRKLRPRSGQTGQKLVYWHYRFSVLNREGSQWIYWRN